MSVPLKSQGLRGLIAAVLVNVICTLPFVLLGAFSVQILAELGLSRASLGLALASFLAAGAVSAALCGRLADKIGPTMATRFAALLASLSLGGIGLTAETLPTLSIWLILGGLGNSLSHSSGRLILAGTVDPARLGRALGVFQSSSSLAGLAAGMAVALVGSNGEWRWVFLSVSISALLTTFVVPNGLDTAATKREPHERMPGEVMTLLVLTAAMALGSAATVPLSAFLVDSATSSGFTPASAGLLLSFGSVSAILARLVVGTLADRRGRGHIRFIGCMLLIGAIGHSLLATQSRGEMVLGTFLAFAMVHGFAGLFFLAIIRLYPLSAGRATGIALTGGMLGAVASPPIFGWLAVLYTYRTAWLAAALWSLLASAGMFWAQRIIGTGRAFGQADTR